MSAEIIQEIAQHLDDRYWDLIAGGESHETAYRNAVERELGTGSELRVQSGGGNMFGNVGQDFRYASRAVRKRAGFTLVAILTLAIGIGATTAIFTVVNSVMLRPLPFPRPDRLVRLLEMTPEGDSFSVSHPNFLDWKQQSRSFDAMAAYSPISFNVAVDGNIERVAGLQVSAGFVPVSGISPALGRNFTDDEDRPGGNNRAAILGYNFWKNRLNRDPEIIGKKIVLNETTFDIVGVLPASFPTSGLRFDILAPLAADPARDRGDHRLLTVARMKNDVTIAQARSEMSAIAQQIGQLYPQSHKGWSIQVESFYDWFVPQETRKALWVLIAAAGFVLVIACSNVANLLLARSTERHKEMSIRIALGSGRYRVVRQLLAEALIVAMLGGMLGMLLAFSGAGALRKLDPGTLPRLEEIRVDGRVFAVSFLVSVMTAVVFGLAPAVQASKPDLTESLKDGGRAGTAGARRQRMRNALVITEVALSIMLIAAAGLLMRSFWRLQKVNLGYEPANVLTMRVNLPASRYGRRPEAALFYSRLLEQLRALPGVDAAAVSSNVPMGGGNTGMSIVQPERPETSTKPLSTDWRIVSNDYFKTLNIPVRGRTFNDGDNFGGTPVVIVSEEMARRFWPGQDVIGKTFAWYGDTTKTLNTIVGVAGDVQNISLDRDPRPVTYRPLAPNSNWNPMVVSLRTPGESASVAGSVRAVMKTIDAGVPIYSIQTAQDLVDLSLGDRRFRMALVACFAAVALSLSCIGLFSVMAYVVSQRTHEIGIRLSLGAERRDVLRLVIGRGMLLAGVGAVIGVGGALVIAGSLKDLLFRIRPTDPVSFAGAVILLLLVSLVACYIPARRATRVDPLVALRHE